MKLTIIGASGHGKVVADIAKLNGYDQIEFLDDNESIKTCAGYPVVGKADAPVEGDVFVAIGNAAVRKKLSERRDSLVTLIHPSAVIADSVVIGKGTVVMAGAIINPETNIGTGCIVNTSSSIDHDCNIGDFVHIAVGAHICGSTDIGRNTWIGAGAVVINNISIINQTIIGAGAVVVDNILEPGTYVGIPARICY